MDSHLYAGYEVPPYYDSLLGKLIVWGPDRATAIARSRVALDELLVDGVITNIPIHRALLANEQFLAGHFTTNLIDRLGSAAFLKAASATSSGAAAPLAAPPAVPPASVAASTSATLAGRPSGVSS
jgi:acetyl/propionyl-CoA carboxylase alpha subunit